MRKNVLFVRFIFYSGIFSAVYDFIKKSDLLITTQSSYTNTDSIQTPHTIDLF